MHRIISLGVNQGPGTSRLVGAENDARAMHAFFTSALGPPAVHATCLVGRDATTHRIGTELLRLALDPPDYLILNFSLHGSPFGVMLANGLLDYRTLAALLDDIPTRGSIVILDTCFAASARGFLKESSVGGIEPLVAQGWTHLLGRAERGRRILFASGADQLSAEDGETQHGEFTQALLQGLRGAQGSLSVGNRRWIAVDDAFRFARQVVAAKRGAAQTPQSMGKTRDFPFALAQHGHPLGVVTIDLSLFRRSLGTHIQLGIYGRRRVPTYLDCRLVRDGKVRGSRRFTVVPASDGELFECDVLFDAASLITDPVDDFLFWHGGRVLAARWEVDVLDALGQPLERAVLPIEFSHRADQAVGF